MCEEKSETMALDTGIAHRYGTYRHLRLLYKNLAKTILECELNNHDWTL